MNQYNRDDVIVFCKTKEQWGAFSNMCGGFPIVDKNGVEWKTSEHWYQAQYFAAHPHLMEELRKIASPMAAKMFRKKNKEFQDPDWMQKRDEIMLTAVVMKYEQHKEHFSKMLIETNGKPIVELSHKDDYWGAKLSYDDMTGKWILKGCNKLGLIWSTLRDHESLV